MAGDEKVPVNTVKELDKVQMWIKFDANAEPTINSIHDKVMLQILQDSYNENDEPLRLLEKSIWDPALFPNTN